MIFKKYLLILCALISFLSGAGQGFFLGTYNKNGSHNGAIFSVNSSTPAVSPVLELISERTGFLPGNFIETDTNIFFGVLTRGGEKGAGSIVRADVTGQQISVVHEFDTANGMAPFGRLIPINTDELLGATSDGGLYGGGVIFVFNHHTYSYKILYHFGNFDSGRNPFEGLVYDDSSGILYGITRYGGMNNHGVLFSFDIKSLVYKKIYDFYFPNRALSPLNNSLLLTKERKLIGSFSAGGANKKGLLFSYNIGDSTYTVIKEFDSATGYPIGTPFIKDSMLYGYSNESIFALTNFYSLNLLTGKFNLLVIPDSIETTSTSQSEIVLLNDSTFLCFGNSGGIYKGGNVYTIDIVNSTFNSLLSFSSSSGYRPISFMPSKLTAGYYAINDAGGSNGNGTLAVFDSLFIIKSVFSFNASSLGKIVGDNVVETKGKKLFVLAAQGGTKNQGSIIEIQYPALTYKTVFHLGGMMIWDTVPQIPVTASLTKVSDSILALTTSRGGEYYGGTICLYSAITNTLFQYYPFKNITSRKPGGRLTSKNGKVYGWLGYFIDDFIAKVLYEYDPTTNSLKEILHLDSLSSSVSSNGNEIIIDNSTVYALVTNHAQPGQSVAILEYDISTKTSNVYSVSEFNSGFGSYGGLSSFGNNLLAFVTYSDGSFGFGKLGLFNRMTKQFEWFNIPGNFDGSNPVGTPLYLSHEQALYFFCARGGTHDKGSLLRFDLIAKNFQKIVDLGAESFYSSIEQAAKNVTFVNEYPLSNNQYNEKVIHDNLILYPNPAKDFAHVKFDKPLTGILTVYDLNGKKLFSTNIEDSRNTSLNVTSLAAGYYFIKMESGDTLRIGKLLID